jgi:hypothetical protein
MKLPLPCPSVQPSNNSCCYHPSPLFPLTPHTHTHTHTNYRYLSSSIPQKIHALVHAFSNRVRHKNNFPLQTELYTTFCKSVNTRCSIAFRPLSCILFLFSFIYIYIYIIKVLVYWLNEMGLALQVTVLMQGLWFNIHVSILMANYSSIASLCYRISLLSRVFPNDFYFLFKDMRLICPISPCPFFFIFPIKLNCLH